MTNINLPKFSIITINYNNAVGLLKSMESVFAQDYSAIEYIIIDGGSTDESKALIEQHSDKLAYWCSEKDNGIYHAMNKGISKCAGDLIIFLNSGDTYISPHLFSNLSVRLDLKGADLFFCRFIWDAPATHDIVLSDHVHYCFDWDLKKSNFPHPATIYKRSLFNSIGLFDESFKILADYDWNARALVKERVVFQYINMITVHFEASGISNDPKHSAIRKMELAKIYDTYFQPSWLFALIEKKQNKFYYPFLKKWFANKYQKRMKRVWH